MIDLALFTNQLNALLANRNDIQALEGVCDLLRMHTSASVRLEGRDGRVIIEIIANNTPSTARLSLPILAGEAVIGQLVLSRAQHFPISQEENLAANIALGICTILMRHREGLLSADKKRRVQTVRAVINNLSFSELEAATHVAKALGGDEEGLLVAGHIADKLGFTRSVITGALRKLESSGLIESRSLGMKGTYIRVKDALLIEELVKL